MKLSLTFATLLVTLATFLVESDAAPARRQPKTITLPVRSLHGRKPDGVHPQVFLQQNINRAERRLARMTGREAPPDHVLRERLEKRMYIIPADGTIDPSRVPGGRTQKRYNSANQMLNTWRDKVKGKVNNNKRDLEMRGGRHHHGGGHRVTTGGAAADGTANSVAGGADGNGAANGVDNAGGAGQGANGVDQGANGADQGANGVDQGANGVDQGANGVDQGANGVDQGANGADQGANGVDQGADQGANGADQGANGADQGANGADQGANGVDQGADQGANGADQGANGADQGANGANQGANAPIDNSAGVDPKVIQAALNGGVTAANPPTADNSLGLNIEGPDTGYLAEVQLGTPPKKFQLLMDSGSADMWVGAENCQSEDGGDCGNHQFLGPQSSSSFQATQTPFQVTYGTGEVQGNIIQDNVDLGGLKLTGHTFGVATLESVDFSSDTTDFDGLIGLAQSTLSQQQTLTPVESLAQQGLIDKAITSYKIPRLADGKNDGEITFGGLDDTKFDAQTLVNLQNVNQQGFWEANMDAVTVDGQDVGLQGRTAILDTGTTLIIAPPNDAQTIHQAIQGAQSDGQGGFIVPCTLNQSVALNFGGQSFAIDPRDIAFLPLDPNDPTGDCSSGISAGQIGGDTEWLVGDVFLKNAYFSTDVTDNSLSLAKLV